MRRDEEQKIIEKYQDEGKEGRKESRQGRHERKARKGRGIPKRTKERDKEERLRNATTKYTGKER